MKYYKYLLVSIFLIVSSVAFAQTEQKAYMVSNAHFDSQWNWDVKRSIEEFIPKTMERNLFLLERYPEYIFNFEGGIKYAWMKEYYPLQYEAVKKYIKEGRWHVTGSTWDANDTNIPSMESFTRNILYGQHFYRQEFGVEGTDIFLPDCFGFGWTLPTVAAHSGLIGFSTQKLMWRHKPFHNGSKIPFEIGLWQGVDGSRIMLVADAHNYTTKLKDEDLSRSQYLKGIAEKSGINTVYHYYGTGDTGGSPTITSVQAIQNSVGKDGPVKIISAESDRLYKDYLPFENHPELPVYDGELLMDVHATGCYTSQAAMKLFNRRNELLADAAERSAVIADWSGTQAYPKEFLTEAWKRFIWHQFHDDLTGTSIPRAYEYSWNDELISMKHFAGALTSSVGAFTSLLDTDVKGTPVVLFNPAAYAVTDVAEVMIEGIGTNVSVYDNAGKKVPCQVVERNGQKVLLIKASVPSMGYAVYDVRKSGSPVKSTLKASSQAMENSVYRLEFNENGDIRSIVDKRNGREMVQEGKAIRLALITDNKSYTWPAWEITKATIDAEATDINSDVKITVVENGPVRAAVKIERRHEESVFTQYVCLTEGGRDARIDIVNDLDWQTSGALLKAEFPLAISNPKAVYDLGVGTIERGNNTETLYEVYAQQWADLTSEDGTYGVTVMNDSKYGWDKPNDNTLRLTLLHTPSTRGGYAYQNRQDMGRHVFTYSIMGHEGDYRKGASVKEAEVLNQPLKAFVAPKHKGIYGRIFSFAESLNENVSMKALKQAEDSDAYVVRFYETAGKGTQKAQVRFASEILEAKEMNGNEDIIADAVSSGNMLEFDVPSYGMKTFLVRLASPDTEADKVVSAPVEIPYNMHTASFNSFRAEVNFDGKGNAYAAELLPERLTFNGVEFVLGDPAKANAIKCRQDTLKLPKGSYNKLYLLAAATRHDTKCTFTVGNSVQEAVVPYYGGFIGQWGHTGHTEGFVKAADVAYVGTHKHNMGRKADVPYDFTYMFCIGLDIPAGAEYVVLPANQQIAVFAASVANTKNKQVTPCCDFMRTGVEVVNDGEVVEQHMNLATGCPVIERTGQVNRSERAECAVDDDPTTKWCDTSAARPKYITVDLEGIRQIRGWFVQHAGSEALDYISKEYSLQVKTEADQEWKTVDTVYDNIDMETERLLSQPTKARFVRLCVTKPDQSEGNIVRIYEFSVF